jgi:diguanylate cyclase (GGDEF)-like protein
VRLHRRWLDTWGKRAQPWPTWAFTGLLAAVVAAAWRPVAQLPLIGAPARVPWLLLAVGFAVAGIVAIRFEISGEAHAATLSEVPLLIGLVFAGADRLLLAALVGSAGSALWRRRSPIKAAFNVATRMVEAVVAAACYHAVLGQAGALSARGWAAAFVALPSAVLASAIGVQIVIALSVGRFDRSGLKSIALVLAGVAVVNVAVGRVAVAVLWVDQAAVVPLLGVAGVLAVGYRAHSELRRRHSDLEQVYRFSSAIEGLVEPDEVIQAVLAEAKSLLRSRVAELTLRGPNGNLRYRLVSDRLVRTVEPEPEQAQQGATALGRIQVSGAAGDGGLSAAAGGRGLRNAVAAPVPVDDGVVGLLLVADRLADNSTFQAADQELLEALASHAAMALRSSQLLDRLRHEVAAKDHQALHDALTGLGNRTLFAKKIETALSLRTGESVVAVMLMDLDRFKEVNDTLGHHTGDVVLQQIADQLIQAVGDDGSVARLGGDEFAFVILASSREHVATVARDVLAGGQASVVVGGLRLEVRASLGVALAPDHGSDRSTLLRRADIAMYHAKTNSTGIEVYQPGRDPHNTRRLVLTSEMHLALESSSLELHYQPKAEIFSGKVSGVEALLRWSHPLYGTIAPSEFIPMAEQTGLIRPLTLWALETALQQLASWQHEGLDLSLAVNLSARSVFDAELAEQLDRLLTRTHVAPASLTLEITESSIFGDRPQGHTVVDDLASLGVRLAIDDFGTGYSSFVRLGQLPVHEVKIDQSFVTDMLTNESHDAIVRSTIDLARNLKLRVVAEGVEDRATWIHLGELGCHAGQGFYLSEALPAEDLGHWLRRRQKLHLKVIEPLRRLAR